MGDKNDGLSARLEATKDRICEKGLPNMCVDCNRVLSCIETLSGKRVGSIPADRGSSRITMSASKYNARAILTLCFCPPLRLIPFSPI